MSAMRCWVALGLLGPLYGCFVDPGNATVGASAAGSTGVAGTTSGTTSGGTGSSGGAPEPTGSGTGAGGSTTTGGTTGPVDETDGAGTSTGGGSSGGGAASTGDLEVPVPGCQPLYFTDFSHDPADELELVGKWTWNQTLGTVTVETVDQESSMAITKGLWKDALVYARARVSSGYAVVRMRSEKQLFEWSNYFGSIRPWVDEVQLGRTVSGNANVFDSAGFASDFGVWYTLTLSVVGNQLSFGVDDQVLVSGQDGMLTAGQASIGGYGMGVVEFDWFLVCAAD